MTYYIGQPVLSVMDPGDAYEQEKGPDAGKPVVRGIVTEVWQWDGVSVWWENCGVDRYCRASEVKPLDN